GIAGLQGKITWDPAMLTLDSAVAGDALKKAGKSLTVSASSGQLLAVGTGLSVTEIPDGTTMVLTFKPTDALVTAGKTSVSCGNVQLSDAKGTGFAGAGGTGTITIRSCSCD